MITKTININSLDKIETFVDIINKFNGRFDLVSGCSIVNAKSIMAIFSLDISRPVYLYIYNEESAEHVKRHWQNLKSMHYKFKSSFWHKS